MLGLSDFFRRRRERESAAAAAAQIQAQGGSVSFGETPATDGGAQISEIPPPPPPGSQAGEGVSVSNQTIDLRNVEGLREEVMEALRQHGVDPEHPGQVDASQMPGLQDAVMAAMKQHGVDLGSFANLAGGGVVIQHGDGSQVFAPGLTAGGKGDPLAARLQELDDLKAQGIISEDEYQQQRQRVLDQL